MNEHAQPESADDGQHPSRLAHGHRRQLIDVAHDALRHGVQQRCALEVDAEAYPAALRGRYAVFVTLFHNQMLRGCVGALQPRRTLVQDTAASAFAAGFEDPRFSPLTPADLSNIRVELSVLDAPRPMTFTDEADLLRQVRPGVDGLILTSNGHQGTFLPAVWEQLPEPARFLAHLKAKAGLPGGVLPAGAVVQRYTVTKVEE